MAIPELDQEKMINNFLTNLQEMKKAIKGMEGYARRLDKESLQILALETRLMRQIVCDWCEDWD